MLSRQAAFCGFPFQKFQSHSKAGRYMRDLSDPTDFLYVQTAIGPEHYFCSSHEVFISDINCFCCCVECRGCLRHAGKEDGNPSRRLGLGSTHWNTDHIANLLGRRTSFFPGLGNGKGFQLNDELLLLPSTLSIYSVGFTCKWRLIYNLHARAMFTAPAHSHLA